MTTSDTRTEKAAESPDTARPDAASRAGWFGRIPGFGDPSARFVHGWAIAQLVVNVGIVVTGGAVRLTGSGLGCPTWPQCTDGSFVPHQALGMHGAIEFGNRMLTWVLVVVAIGTWLAVFRHRDSTRGDRWLATLIALGIPFQAVIGGISVLTDLNPWVVSLHFVLSMALVSAATVLVFRTSTRVRQRATNTVAARLGNALSWLIYLFTWATIYIGTVVTGSGPHAGDADAPRNGLDPGAMTQLHADFVFVLVGLALAVAVTTRVLRMPQTRAAFTYVALLALQGIIGGIQYATNLPMALVIAHMLGSGLLMIGATWLVLWFGRDQRAPADVTSGTVTPGADAARTEPVR
ncbi:COX15/CtaA family protein [Gordonia otitidis]|uniref:Cytochrome oxidase assembly protein n=1 Tax=Gordonia otitidis (strain DSM 44809 / CCUG 52243 / JCM 12355 / NBRC 100426 / IFM 10032) TaxID=1108044 RepID=H5TP13_GORO1|nr:COX15/CtaA family protein [Gordonia otitidis]GAB35221.1 putative cytochrome oxidase assembly protein [Gordonia otitidis NBRC 100426]